MIANLHTHTPRCRHARGTEIEYIEAAIQRGLRTLGFSDHTPYWFPGDYYTHMRMFPEQLEEYAQTILTVRKDYAGVLEIPLGLEVEYYPAYFPELRTRLQDAGIEYMLLGQHWCGNEIEEEYNGYPTEDARKLQRYCDQLIEAIETGLFTYIAHPDLLHFVGEPRIYEEHMRRLCKAAKSCEIPLEFNLLGQNEQRHYPHPLMWALAAEEGCSVVLGIDAHKPQHILDLQEEKTALAVLKELGITPIENPIPRWI